MLRMASTRPALFRSCAASLVLFTACFHVDLDPVPPRASSADRIAAYNRLRPAEQHLNGVSLQQDSSIALADGNEIVHADDLLPVLDPSTPSARAAKQSRSARQTTTGLAAA